MINVWENYEEEYLIIEEPLFFTNSLKNEIAFYIERHEESSAMTEIGQKVKNFNIDIGKPLNQYSSGQRLIISVLLNLTVMKFREIKNIKILLTNSLKALSQNNRQKIEMEVEEFFQLTGIRFYTLEGSEVRELIAD